MEWLLGMPSDADSGGIGCDCGFYWRLFHWDWD